MGRNPFEQWPDEAMGRVFALPPELGAALAHGVRVAEIVGGCGCGKSTHLAAIGRLAAEHGQPWVYRHLLNEPPGQPPAGGWWLLDEAQALSPDDLVAVVSAGLSAGAGVALGSHRRLTRRLERLGPVHRLRLPRRLSPGESADLLDRWLAAAGRGTASQWLEPAALARLARLSGGVPRRLVRLAYELAEDHPPDERIGPSQVTAAWQRLRRDAPLLFAPPSPGKAPCACADPPSSWD